MRRLSKHSKKIAELYKETKKGELLVYLILRGLVVVCMLLQLVRGDLNNAFLCLFTLLLFTIPTFIEDKLKIEFPTVLESTVYVFIFAAEVLGEINNFYGMIPHWDTMLHTLNGFLCAGVGFSLVDLLNENSDNLNLSPFFVAVVAFCFSMTIGVFWEFFEFGMDQIVKTDMQKDTVVSSIYTVKLNESGENKAIAVKDISQTYIVTGEEVQIIENGYLDVGLSDTMLDLFVNFEGALWFSIIGFLHIQNRESHKVINGFIPKKKKDTDDM